MWLEARYRPWVRKHFYALAGNQLPKALCFRVVRARLRASLKIGECDILQTACGNFAKFTI